MNNADLGITIQKFICDYFNLPIPLEAQEQFYANYNEDYVDSLNIKNIVASAFNELGSIPKECVTYTSSNNVGEKYNPNNFVLANS